jgi:hypothetical protein
VNYLISNGNSCFVRKQCTRTFTVPSQEEGPVILADTATIQLDCNEPYPAAGEVEVSESCGGPVNLEVVLDTVTSGCTETLTRTWIATDACGNSSSAEQKIHRSIDNQPPVFAGTLPQDMSLSCDEVPAADVVEAIDDCGLVTIEYSEETIISGSDCPVTVTLIRTWVATDHCGLTSMHVQTIEVVDNNAPVPTDPPADICGPGLTLAEFDALEIGPIVFVGVCSGEEVSSGDPEVVYSCEDDLYTITWTAEDACGNIGSHTQLICLEKDPISCEILGQENIICGEEVTFSAQVSNGIAPYTLTWELSDSIWETVVDSMEGMITLLAGPADALLTLSITDAEGCMTSCAIDLDCRVNGTCTQTNTFFGNPDSLDCAENKAASTIADAIGSGDLVIGQAGQSFTLTASDSACAVDLFTGNGDPLPLEAGDGSCAAFNFAISTEGENSGQSENSLVSELLTLKINIAGNPALGYVRMEGNCLITRAAADCDNIGPFDEGVVGTEDTFCIPQQLMDTLGIDFKVSALAELADRALAGTDVGITLEELMAALSAINDAFANCRIIVGFLNDEAFADRNDMMDKLFQKQVMSLSPNPASSVLRIVVNTEIEGDADIVIMNPNGVEVERKEVKTIQGINHWEIKTDEFSGGVYILYYIHDKHVIYSKFIKVN